MINTTVVRETRGSDTLDLFLEAFPGLLEDELTAAFDSQIKPFLLDELRYYPRPAVLPFEFATAKSRRWYFWAVRTGLIKTSTGRYQRTGDLARGWRVDIVFGDGAVALSVGNKRKEVKYVTGKRQVPGHANTGWPKHEQTILFWQQAAADVADQTIANLINRR